MIKNLHPFLLILFFVTIANCCFAASPVWTNTAGGSWSTPGNWSTGVAPVAGDNVTFSTAGTYTVTGVPTLAINSLAISGSAIVTLQGTNTTLTIGVAGAGNSLSIASGSSLTLNSTTATGTSSNIVNITMGAATTVAATITGTLNVGNGTVFSSPVAVTVSVTTGVLNVSANSLTSAATNGGVNNGTLLITGGAFTVSKTLTVAGYYYHSSSTAITSTGTISFTGYGVYEHATSAAGNKIPTATWASTSTVLVTGITATAPTGFSQTFGNIIWNCTGQTATISMGFSSTTTIISGNFSVLSTGTTVNVLEPTNTAGTTVSILGNLLVSGTSTFVLNASGSNTTNVFSVGGDVTFTGTSTIEGTNSSTPTLNITIAGNLYINGGTFTPANNGGPFTLTVNGDFNIEGGVFNFGPPGGSSKTYAVNLGGNFNFSSGSFSVLLSSSPTSFTFNFIGGKSTVTFSAPTNSSFITAKTGKVGVSFVIASGKTVILNSDFALQWFSSSDFASLTVNSGGVLDCGSSYRVIANSTSGGGAFILNGTLKTANSGGVGNGTSIGSIQVNSTRVFNAGANYEFYGATSTPFPTGAATFVASTVGNVICNAPVTLNTAVGTNSGTNQVLVTGSGGLNLNSNNVTNTGTTDIFGILTVGTNTVSGTGGTFTLENNSTLTPTGNTYTTLIPTGVTTLGSNIITSVSSISGLVAGMSVVGTGIPAGTTVSSVSGTTIMLSQNATLTSTASIEFYIGLAATGTVTNASTSVTNVSFTTGVVVGMSVTGAGIPAGTTVSAIAGTTITLSASATATNSNTLLVFGYNTISGISSISNILTGMAISGSGIPSNTYVTSVDATHNIVFTSNNITTTNSTATYTFSSAGGIVTSSGSGVDGNITVTGTETFKDNASYTFNTTTTTPFSVASQTSPITAYNLTCATGSSGNVTQNKSAVSVTNAMTLTTGTFSINGNTLTLNGTYTSSSTSGTLTGSASSNLIVGSTATSIPLTFTYDAAKLNDALLSLTVNANASLANGSTSSRLYIVGGTSTTPGYVTVSGSAVFTTNDSLVLQSNANGTAQVGANTSGNKYYIAGKVSVERYFPSHRSWRLLTAPIRTTGAPTINASWQEGFSNYLRTSPQYASTADVMYGTIITKSTTESTSDGGITTTDGYDQGSTNNPSILYFTGSSWSVPSATNTGAVTDKPGYMLFVRGGRDYIVNTVATPPTFTTLRVKGNLIQGDTAINGTGLTIIGNPYASSFYYDGVISRGTNVPSYYYVWDPLMTGSNGVGAFVTMQYTSAHTYSATPDPTVTPISSGVINLIAHPLDLTGTIQSGQAIFTFFNNSSVPAAGNSTIVESDKTTGNDTYVFRPATPALPLADSLQSFRTNLYALNSDTTTSLEDGVLDLYNTSYSNSVNYLEDAPKLGNILETISLLRNGHRLSIESRKPISITDTVFYTVSGMQQKKYILEFVANGLNYSGLTGLLIDSFLNTQTPVSLNGTTDIPFTVSNDPASASTNRFTVVFNPENVPLPVTFTNVKATKQNIKNIAVQWSVVNQLDIKQYEVERSSDGISFSVVDTTIATGNNATSIIYNWIDNNAIDGDNYYRIASVGADGKLSYSKIVKVQADDNSPMITVYPNPIQDGKINLQFKNIPEGTYAMRLINDIGQVITQETINYVNGNNTASILFNSSIAKGVYNLEITGPANYKNNIRIVY